MSWFSWGNNDAQASIPSNPVNLGENMYRQGMFQNMQNYGNYVPPKVGFGEPLRNEGESAYRARMAADLMRYQQSHRPWWQ